MLDSFVFYLLTVLGMAIALILLAIVRYRAEQRKVQCQDLKLQAVMPTQLQNACR